MKSIEAFIEEIEGSAALQDEIKAVKEEGAFAEFLKKHDVEGTAEEFADTVKEKAEAEDEISDDDLEAVVGGVSVKWTGSGMLERHIKSIWSDHFARYDG